MPMSGQEIIDLTESSALAAVTSSQEPTTNTLSTELKSSPTEKEKKQRRKRAKKTGTQSQETTAPNTRHNSEERENEEMADDPQNGRPVRRKHEHVATTKDSETSSSRLPDRITTGSKNKYTLSSGPISNGNANANDLFFEDVNPAPLPPTVANLPQLMSDIHGSSSQKSGETKLLLPAHVSVLGSTPVEILPPEESDEEGDTNYIKYLEYGGDHEKEFLRYFEEPEDELLKLKRTVCKNCGAEGDHKTAHCRILICLTCGVRDEHVTKSCPVSKVCFSCGMKGHINSNCPNRHMARIRDHDNSGRCDRCYSDTHQTSECPTWWRLYVYVVDDARSQILGERRSKRELELGKGGEGYIAEDEWCYNCGETGHWGDDCQDPKRYDKPAEPSAFGLYNICMGPFYHPDESGAPVQHKRRLREWEREDQFGNWGEHAPDHVGRQGRKKMMEKMRRNAQKFEEESDPEDWFGNSRNARNRGTFPGDSSSSRQDREKQRQRDRAREYDRKRERGRERDKNRDGDRDGARVMQRDGERERDKERNGERGPRRERDLERGARNGDEASIRTRNGEDGKVKIKIASLGSGRKFLPPPPPDLPVRPPPQSRPSLLERLGDKPLKDPPPLRSSSQPHNPISLSIKGAGQKQSRDGSRDRHHPRYRGGYSR